MTPFFMASLLIRPGMIQPTVRGVTDYPACLVIIFHSLARVFQGSSDLSKSRFSVHWGGALSALA